MKGRSRSSRIGMGLSGRMGVLVPMGMGITGAGRGDGVMRSARIALSEITDMPEAGREEEAGLRAVTFGAAFLGAAFLAAALGRAEALRVLFPAFFVALGAAFFAAFLFGAARRGAFFAVDFRAALAAVPLRLGAAFFFLAFATFAAFAITPSSPRRGRGL